MSIAISSHGANIRIGHKGHLGLRGLFLSLPKLGRNKAMIGMLEGYNMMQLDTAQWVKGAPAIRKM